MNFCPLFIWENGQKPTFILKTWAKMGLERLILDVFSVLWPKKVGKSPLLKSKVGLKKSLNHGVFRPSSPLSHFFSILIVIKK